MRAAICQDLTYPLGGCRKIPAVDGVPAPRGVVVWVVDESVVLGLLLLGLDIPAMMSLPEIRGIMATLR